MRRRSGLIMKLVAMTLLLTGIITGLNFQPDHAGTASRVLPTQMVLPTAEATQQTASSALEQPTVTDLPVVQPTSIPPTPLPPEPEHVSAQEAVSTPADIPLVPDVVASAEPPIPVSPAQPVPDQITVQFRPGTSADEQAAYIQALGGTVIQNIAPLNTVVLSIPGGVSAQAVYEAPVVAQAEPDYFVTAQGYASNDPYYASQWALPVTKVPPAWEFASGVVPVVIAVLDSGICASHPDLAGRILPGYDFVQRDNVPQDEFGHGCQVSGVIAANINNGLGMAGVAPNTMIMPLRVLDAVGSGSYSNVAAAIVYAADNGADIINLSLGGSVSLTILENAVNYAVDRGVIVIAAAGNTNGGAVIYPAAYPNAIAVGSVAQDLIRSSFSAVGPEIDTWAPGSSILTTSLSGGYTYASGTSFAAPNVSGMVALYMALNTPFPLNGDLMVVTIPQPSSTDTPTPAFDKYGRPILPAADQSVPTDMWAVVLAPGNNPNAVAASLGYINLGQVGTLENTYLFRAGGSSSGGFAAQSVANALAANTRIVWFEQQFEQAVYSRDVADDPLYSSQWHLPDLNVPGAWLAGYTGAGVQVAIVDDGLQITHPDLASNYFPQGSRDFNSNDNDPSPLHDYHGTEVAGVVGAADNTTCGVGVAYNASLSGIRLTGAATTDATKAVALTYANGVTGNTSLTNDIYNSSWGPQDNGRTLGGAGSLTLAALQDSVTRGRGLRGSIYVWAAGNGGFSYDNVNADSYANSRFVIAVTAVTHLGEYPDYTELGAPILVSAPSSGDGQGIITTDLAGAMGETTNDCENDFGGTSAAAPMVSGVIALMLEANPNLTWRDVQYILIETAVQNDPTEPDWTTNGAGYPVNHNYGFGLVDAEAAVNLAATWQNVGPEGVVSSPIVGLTAAITSPTLPDTCGPTVTRTTTVISNRLAEHVVVRMNLSHSYRGDLVIWLTSPSGTESVLMTERPYDSSELGYSNWQFMSVRHWGENPTGIWTLNIADCAIGDNGTLHNWQLFVYTQDAPPTPTLLAPANGGQLNTIGSQPQGQVALNWTSAAPTNNNGFQLYLDTDNDPSDVTPIIVNGTSYTASLPLGEYSWQVRAVGNATVGDSALTGVSSFTVVTPANASPSRNFFTTGTPTLTWMSVSWATSYRVEVSTLDSFNGPLVFSKTLDATQLSVELDADTNTVPLDPFGEGLYYWRVCAISGTKTTCSPPDSFYIDP